MDQELQKHLEAKPLVEQCLAEDQRCRNDDLWLILSVWRKKQGAKIYIDYHEMPHLISFETIRRHRQHIQNTEHKYPPTDPKIMIKRKMKEETLRKHYGEHSTILQQYKELRYEIQ